MLHHFLHEIVRIWFHWVDAWGTLGVFVLMAMESSVIPVPSELVMPPAAFWATQGRGTSFWGVVAAGTLGSYLGSLISYWIALCLGRSLVFKYRRFFFLSEDKLQWLERWVARFGSFGVFIARLLPVVRHLISIPAGAFRMPFLSFSFSTLIGAGLWCTLLSWFGKKIIGSSPELLQSPEAMVEVIKSKMIWFVALVVVIGVLYGVVVFSKKKMRRLSSLLLILALYSFDAKALEVSAVGSLNLSHYDISPSLIGTPSGDLYLGGGGLLSFDLFPFFSLESGALWTTHGFSVNTLGATTSFSNSFISIPAMVRFEPFSLTSIGVGGYYSFCMHSFVSGLPLSSLLNLSQSPNYSGKNDFGLLGSVGVRLPITPFFKFRLDALYEFGLSSLSSGTSSQNSRNLLLLVGFVLVL